MHSSAAPASRTDSATATLREQILRGEATAGELMAESAVAHRLGVSRVPVREALFTLEREGLVEFSGTGRAYVKDLTSQDFEELFVVRLALEPLAAKLATPFLSQNPSRLLDNLAATRRARSVREVTRLDLEFHELILAASGNARLLKLWRSMRGQLELWLSRLHHSHQMQTRKTQRETLEAHEAILACFQTQSPSDCERLMRQHIFGWREWLPTPPSAS